jgi:aminopeptidase N
MKRLIFICIALVSISFQGIGQKLYLDNARSLGENIVSLLNDKKYYEAIILMDMFTTYRNGLIETKCYTYYLMNDMQNASRELKMAKALDIDFSNTPIELLSDPKAVALKLYKTYDPEIDTLDYLHGYKLFYTRKDTLRGKLSPLRSCFDVYYYNLSVRLIPEKKRIEGTNEIYFKIVEPTSRIQLDLNRNLAISSITLDGKALSIAKEFDAVFIDLPRLYVVGEQAMIKIAYNGVPHEAKNPPWNGGFVWEKKRSKWKVGVACEHLGASSWWPCKDHLSDKPDSVSINLQVPEGYGGVANGQIRASQLPKDGYETFNWFVSYPINTYNVTVNMGKFEMFSETYQSDSTAFPIDYYVTPSNVDAAKEYYKDTREIFRVFEKLFGPYPFPKDGAAFIETPYSGMEHQGIIAIGDDYESKGIQKYGKKAIDRLVIHETAHEWWGNTVAANDMADIWISEAFATYAENLFAEEMLGYEAYLHGVAQNMSQIFNIWPLVGNRDVNDMTFPGGDIYQKGACMLHNFRCSLNNDSLFFAIIKGFYSKHKFKTIATADFISYVNTATAKDFTVFFNEFLLDATPPVLEYRFKYVDNKLEFTYRWTKVNHAFEMPFCIVLNQKECKTLIATARWQTLTFDGVSRFSLPTYDHYYPDIIGKNAFTYYWTSWNK